MLKTLIVDDELHARESLAAYLTKYCPDVQLIGDCSNVEEALLAINTQKPDLVFLDIEMPFGTGFDLLDQLEEIDFSFVFVTAYSDYAIRALNMSAAYYILKPIDIDELIGAVEKVKEEHNTEKTKAQTDALKSYLSKGAQKLILPQLEGFEIIKTEDIIRCQANDNFTDFFLEGGRKIMVCRTLKFYENILTEFNFVRVHKSHLINPEKAIRIIKGKGGQVIMSDDEVVPVAPKKKQELMNILMI